MSGNKEMNMDNIIKELKLQLGHKELSLTMDEAQKLKEALDELFGNGSIPYGQLEVRIALLRLLEGLF
jgi:hypothetical protein